MSSRIEEQWQDSGSGYGRMQRVRVFEPNALQVAYRAFLDHASICPDCNDQRCPTAEPLWRTYWAERQKATARASAVERR